ncbi:ParA family protein [Chondrinema litorale]|uniref:ParA family protein n=1 Tax=Chondrinema litorale TaxID=2994555 RepID=UPI002543C2BE|nr:AAA family ATPase [Chondrinema litorale]UZR98624.1 AAA family ATPase [Chondrinema litorale]
MEIIAISNQKGGVGKTTSVSAISEILSKSGKKVVMIDLDPQANLSKGLGIEKPDYTIQGVLFDEYGIEEAVEAINDNLLLIPCTKALANFEIEMLNEIGREYILKNKIKALEGQCDYIILDSPPSLGLLTINALSAAESVYVPIHAQKYSLDGLHEVLETIDKVKEFINPGLKFKGAYFNQYDQRKLLTRALTEEVKEMVGEEMLLNTFIRVNVALQEAPTLGKSILEYAPESNGAVDFKNLTDEIISR